MLALSRLHAENPDSFEHFIERLGETRPRYGTITLHFLSGKYTRTTVEDSR